MRRPLLAALAIAVVALCGCGDDSDDLSGLAGEKLAKDINTEQLWSLRMPRSSTRTSESSCTENPVQPSPDSISYLCKVDLLVGVTETTATVEVVCNPTTDSAPFSRGSPRPRPFLRGGVAVALGEKPIIAV